MQGEHQPAQKSMRTMLLCSTISVKFFSVMTTVAMSARHLHIPGLHTPVGLHTPGLPSAIQASTVTPSSVTAQSSHPEKPADITGAIPVPSGIRDSTLAALTVRRTGREGPMDAWVKKITGCASAVPEDRS